MTKSKRTTIQLRNSTIFCLIALTMLMMMLLSVEAVFGIEPEPSPSPTPGESGKKNSDIFQLEDAIELASKVHPELKSAIALKNAAVAQVIQARSVYFPQVSFSSSYTRSENGNRTTNSSLPGIVNASDSYQTSMSLNQKIYDFGRTAYSVIAARENLKATEYDILTTSDGIILSVRESYYNAVAAEKVLQVTQETIQQQELHLKQASGFYQVGKRSKIEVTKAKVDLANAQLNLIKAENAVELTKIQLANAIGIEKLPNKPLNDQINFVEMKMDKNRALEYAKNHRPELLKMISTENIYNARLKQAKAEWYPTINGSTSYGYNDNNYVFENNNSWSWGLSLNFDVFTGGSRNAQITSSRENLSSISSQKVRLWQNITLEVQQVLLNLEEAKKRISVLETALDQARENFSLAQGRYEVGVGDNIEFSDARIALQQAKIDLIKAILDYHIARAQLEKAIGVSVFKTSLKNSLAESK